jgi:antitoxin YefM
VVYGRNPSLSKTLPISEVKTRLPELVSGVAEREEEIVVTRNGKPAAVLVNYDEYERLKDTLDVLSDPILMKQIAQSKNFYAGGAKTVLRSGFRRIARCGETSEEIVAIDRPDIPPHVAEVVRHLPPDVKRSVKQALRSLSSDPFAGAPLMRDLSGL